MKITENKVWRGVECCIETQRDWYFSVKVGICKNIIIYRYNKRHANVNYIHVNVSNFSSAKCQV